MKNFGKKKGFAMEYDLKDDSNEVCFNLYIENKNITIFEKNGLIGEFKWDIRDLVEWMENNLEYILNEEGFPLDVNAETAVEFIGNSNDFDSDDEMEFDSWYEKRQEWSFRHSWYSSRAGGFLADIYFRRVNDDIEISWDNSDLYNGIKFVNPTGVYYINHEIFENIFTGFISSFKMDIEHL